MRDDPNPTIDRLEEAITERLLDQIENPGDEGTSAAMLQAAMKWHQHIKTGKAGAGEVSDPIAEAIEAMRRANQNGGKLPPVDLEGDDSTV